MGSKTRYSINLEARFSPLELIDVQTLVDACKDAWYNQTLCRVNDSVVRLGVVQGEFHWRSEEHTSELQSRLHLVCRLLLEKKKKKKKQFVITVVVTYDKT